MIAIPKTVKRHKIKVVRKGSLCDLVDNIFGNKGEVIQIGNRNYVLREVPELDEQIKKSIRENIVKYLRENPLNYFSTITSTIKINY